MFETHKGPFYGPFSSFPTRTRYLNGIVPVLGFLAQRCVSVTCYPGLLNNVHFGLFVTEANPKVAKALVDTRASAGSWEL